METELRDIYHIFTCVSVRLRLSAKFNRSHTDRYRVVLNLFSSDTSCSYVNAVLALSRRNVVLIKFHMTMLKDMTYRRGFELFPCDFPSPFFFESLIFESVSLPSISLPIVSSHMSSGSMSFRSFAVNESWRWTDSLE